MRNCDYYEELISRSLDEKLSVEERKALAVHLASCPSCSQMRMLMADISGLMEEDMEELPDGLHEDIMASIRRSEMIKKNGGNARAVKTGRAGKAKTVKPARIPRTVRNLLATAACMALVIAAAISLNPGERAEAVVMSRNAPLAADTAEQNTAPSTAPQSDEMTAATAQPSPTAVPEASDAGQTGLTQQPETQSAAVNTPVPQSDPYGDWRTPVYPDNSGVQGDALPQDRTIINPATPTPQPVATPEPAPVTTPVPEVQEQLPQMEPQQQEIIAGNHESVDAGAAEIPEIPADKNTEANVQPEITGEVHKTAPVRVFGLFPSLSGLEPTATPAADGVQEGVEVNAGAVAAEADAPVPAEPTPCPDPVEMDLMDKENGGDVLLLLMGMLDENGMPPQEVEELKDGYDSCYIISLVYNEIPCEITARISGEEVYFTLAEIVIEPAENGGNPEMSGQTQPAGDPGMEALPESGTVNCPVTGSEADEDFEPIWFLADCSSSELLTLLETLTK